MLPIKSTLSRVGRTARHIELLQKNAAPPPQPRAATPLPPKPPVPKAELKKWRRHLDHYQTKVYRDFLTPLGMDNLKVFNDPEPFDAVSAHAKWRRLADPSPKQQFHNYLEEKTKFEQMALMLIDSFPNDLKNVDSPARLARTFGQTHAERTPRHHYHELPPMPKPLTPEAFERWIYSLTHTRHFYRNSLSLSLGIIPDILLQTHHLDNREFKAVRLVHTYNHLIYYFASKNQSSFAREILLVMTADGHHPNTTTINNLLRVCRFHAHNRLTSSTYSVILKYLSLARTMGIPLDFELITRVYDATNNLFLRELLLSQLQAAEIPISPSLMTRVVDDFCATTTSTAEVIKFLETDFGRDWRRENVLFNKVVGHQLTHDLAGLAELVDSVAVDAYTIKLVVEGIRRLAVPHKGWMMLQWYWRLRQRTPPTNPHIFALLINQLIAEGDQLPYATAIAVKGLIADMTCALALPTDAAGAARENYKIALRVCGGTSLMKLEARGCCVGVQLAHPLSLQESHQWRTAALQPFDHLAAAIPQPTVATAPGGTLATEAAARKQYHAHRTRALAARDRLRIEKARMGADRYLDQVMRTRGLW